MNVEYAHVIVIMISLVAFVVCFKRKFITFPTIQPIAMPPKASWTK